MITPSWADYGTHDEAYYPELWHRLEFASCPALGGSPRNLARQGIYTPTIETNGVVINGVAASEEQSQTLAPSRRINHYSFIGWYYTTVNISYNILATCNLSTWGSFTFHTDSNGKLYTAAGSGSLVVTASGYNPVNVWIMYGVIADGVNVTLYKYNYSDAIQANYVVPSQDALEMVINRDTGASATANYYANAMFWDRAISRAEIALLAQSPTIAYTPRRRTVRRLYSIPATFNPAWARHSNIHIPAGARLA